MVKTKEIGDILTEEEIKKYEEEWKNFRGKYKINSGYNVHCSLVVIGEVYQFQDKPVFRAHIFNKRLRKVDPYFIAEKCLLPFWSREHYFITAEQLYHASMQRIRGNLTFSVESGSSTKFKRKTFWRDNISVELLYFSRERGGLTIEDCFFTWYDDKKNRIMGKMHLKISVTDRAFVRDLKALKRGDKEALKGLLRKIERQDINLHRLKKPRKDLKTTREELTEALKRGEIPEEKLIDFFSLWDKEPGEE